MGAGSDMEMAEAGDEEISAEDSGRASFYAIIGRLFYAPPEAGLIAQIVESGSSEVDPQDEEAGAGGALEAAWRGLQRACQESPAHSILEEHQRLFIGVGKAQVTPFTSAFVTSIAPDRHLVQLRQQLLEWGLARQDMVFDSEDHVSGLCDVMRYLIEQKQMLESQRRFFLGYVEAGGVPFCDAVIAARGAVFYAQVALFAKAYFEVEKAAFDMLSLES